MELYGWDDVLYHPEEIVICEGEFDRLVLKAQGFRSVTSTGGARAFRPEWAKYFEPIAKVYICFDRDEAGREGALHVGQLIPHARIVELPEEVGEGGDVTDFFVRLGRTDEEFRKLFEQAVPVPPPPPRRERERTTSRSDLVLRQRIDELKHGVEIADVLRRYVELQPAGENMVGLCPFHEDHQPSLTVYPETGTFYCFGCRAHGDVIDFLRRKEGLSFREAIDALEGLSRRDGQAA